MSDLISRQDAIDVVDKCDAIYINNLPVMADKLKIRKALLQLPSAQPDNSCDGCKYENADDGVLVPCGFCKRSHPDNYERRTNG